MKKLLIIFFICTQVTASFASEVTDEDSGYVHGLEMLLESYPVSDADSTRAIERYNSLKTTKLFKTLKACLADEKSREDTIDAFRLAYVAYGLSADVMNVWEDIDVFTRSVLDQTRTINVENRLLQAAVSDLKIKSSTAEKHNEYLRQEVNTWHPKLQDAAQRIQDCERSLQAAREREKKSQSDITFLEQTKSNIATALKRVQQQIKQKKGGR